MAFSTHDKALHRLEIIGRVANLSLSEDKTSCLIATLANGLHICPCDTEPTSRTGGLFNCNPNHKLVDHEKEKGSRNEKRGTSKLTGSSVETYRHETVTQDLVTAACFLNSSSSFVAATNAGGINVISRSSRTVSAYTSLSRKAPVKTLCSIPDQPSEVLVCTAGETCVLDVDRMSVRGVLASPDPTRAVTAVSLSCDSFAVANYDGKVLLYDVRQGYEPVVVLSIPDQLCSMSVCETTGSLAIGTVSGRVFTARGQTSSLRERAFGTGKIRAPVRSIDVSSNTIVAGDTEGRVSLIDASDDSRETIYWTPSSLFHSSQSTPWSAVAVALDAANSTTWCAFAAPEFGESHVVAVTYN